jgi:hypothetical protein
MAEKLVRVCDVCGETPADTIRIAAKGKNREKDLCSKHLAELLDGSRGPRRGRRPHAQPVGRPDTGAAATRRARPRKAKAA